VDDRRLVCGALAAHGRWIERFPSLYSSANNHRIAELVGLHVLGSLLECPDASGWAASAAAGLETEARRQIHDDGVGVEQSPTYTAFSLELLLIADAVARATDAALSTEFVERIRLAGDHLLDFTDCRGNTPRIGDDDEGRVVLDAEPSHRYVHSIACQAAAAGGGVAVHPVRYEGHLRKFILGDPTVVHGPRSRIRTFEAGGYTVARDTTDDEVLVVIDHGPLGQVPLAAHGHADTLALWVHVNGEPFLVDAGTYRYHGDSTVRNMFRSAGMHNTLTLGGLSSSEPGTNFSWRSLASGRLVRQVAGDSLTIDAEHDGWLSRLGITHGRSVSIGAGGAIAVTDVLFGAPGTHLGSMLWMFAPGSKLHGEGLTWTVESPSGRSRLTAVFDPAVDVSPVVGDDSLGRNWYSPRFGQRERAVCLIASGELVVGQPVETSLQIQSNSAADYERPLAEGTTR